VAEGGRTAIGENSRRGCGFPADSALSLRMSGAGGGSSVAGMPTNVLIAGGGPTGPALHRLAALEVLSLRS
jgi:hypothetical protein